MAPLSDSNCPACAAAVTIGGNERIAACPVCNHRWMVNSVQEHRTVEETVYTHDYAGYRADPIFEKSVRMLLETEIASRRPPPAAVLDVGCGSGDFLLAAVERGYTVQGIDVSRSSAEICRARGLKAMSGDYLSEPFEQDFDVITMWDVIEHLRDPGAFFERTRQLLRPGGVFFGKVPGFGSLSVNLSKHVPRLAGQLLGAPNHVQYFRQDTLERLGKRYGFAMEWVQPPFAGMRQRPKGGSLKRRLGRRFSYTVRALSRDENLYFAARPA